MSIEAGDEVRCLISATHLWTVEATDVERDVAVDAARVWRLPEGDTVIRHDDTAMVVSAEQLHTRESELR